MVPNLAMRSSVLRRAACSVKMRSAMAEVEGSVIPPVCPKAAPAADATSIRILVCRMALLTCDHALSIRSVFLAMEIAGMGRRMEGEDRQRWDVVRIHTIAKRRGIREAGNQDSGQRAEPDIDYVVVRTATTERPTGVVTTERSKAALAGKRSRSDGQIDARDVRNIDAQQILAGRGRYRNVVDAIQNPRCEERVSDELRELLVKRRKAAIPIILHRKRNQSFHSEGIAHAIDLHVIAVILRIVGARPDRDDLPERGCPPADVG